MGKNQVMNYREKLFKFLYLLIPFSLVTQFFDFYLGITTITFALKLIGLVATLFVLRNSIKECYSNNNIKYIAIIFLCYYVFTSIFYLFNGRPFSCLLNEYYNFIPAFCFFFIGMSDKDRSNAFYRFFLFSCTISMIIGLGLYVSAPDWYIARNTEIANKAWYATTKYSDNDTLSILRFSSYLGDSYSVDIYSVTALSLSLFFFYLGSRQRFRFNKKKKIYLLFCIVINFVASIMTQQRVAMVVAVVFLFAYFIYGFLKGYGRTSLKLFLFFFLLLIVSALLLYDNFGDRLDMLQVLLSNRMENMSFSKALSERSYQIDLLRNHWDSPVLGMGAGAGESMARSLGFPGVSDCSYIALLFDTGVVGGLLFFLIMLKSIARCLHFLRYYLVELSIMFFVLVAMIGSNTIHMGFMFVIPFWYAIGRIWNNGYYEYAVDNGIFV